MEPEGSLPCSQEPDTISILSQMNPNYTFQQYFPLFNFFIMLYLELGLPDVPSCKVFNQNFVSI
jgi:hypothetical protein